MYDTTLHNDAFVCAGMIFRFIVYLFKRCNKYVGVIELYHSSFEVFFCATPLMKIVIPVADRFDFN